MCVRQEDRRRSPPGALQDRSELVGLETGVDEHRILAAIGAEEPTVRAERVPIEDVLVHLAHATGPGVAAPDRLRTVAAYAGTHGATHRVL